MDAQKAFGLILKQEGISLTCISNDKGGLTKFGISAAAHPGIDIEHLTIESAQAIYANDYWAAGKCSDLKPELQYAHFSCCVNCGVGSANKILQRASKVTDDGIIGPATLAEAQHISIYDYAIEWNMHYKAIVEKDKTQEKFMKGWQNRIDTIIGWWKAGTLN